MRENLKKARQRLGLTQQQMAEKLGITARMYQRLESGEALGKITHWDRLEDITGTLKGSFVSNRRISSN